MSAPRITSVECYRKGAHDEVYVFVDCKLSGILRVDEGAGARLAETIRQGATLDELREEGERIEAIARSLPRVLEERDHDTPKGRS